MTVWNETAGRERLKEQSMKNTEILATENLSAGYGEKTVIEDLSFTLHRGEILCLAGESGCGKSTLLRTLLSLPAITVRAGDIRVGGTGLSALQGKKRSRFCSEKMGMIFQSPGASFNPIRSYKKQFIETMKSHDKYDRNTFDEQVNEAFAKLELEDPKRLIGECPYALSGGMNQRMAIALALLLKQEILLCDEPTSALDATIALQVAQELKKLRDESGISQIIVTHNLGLAAFMADRIGIMNGGRLVEIGDAKQILYHPAHPYTQSLLQAVPRLEKTASFMAEAEVNDAT